MNLPADERLAGLLSEGDTCLASDAVDEDSLALCRGRNIAMLSSPGVAEGKAFPLPAQARDSCFRHFLLASRAARPRLTVCFCTDALVLQYVFIHFRTGVLSFYYSCKESVYIAANYVATKWRSFLTGTPRITNICLYIPSQNNVKVTICWYYQHSLVSVAKNYTSCLYE